MEKSGTMEKSSIAEDVIVRYLLGELADDEQIRLEERAFTDPRLTLDVLAAESDLIDEYVRGGLAEPRRRRFESRFFASEERRRKVEFAKALARVADRPRRSEQPARLRGWQASTSWLRGPTPGLRFAVSAAVLFLLLGVTWWIAEKDRPAPRRAEPRTFDGSAAGSTLAGLFLPPGLARGGAGRPRLVLPESGAPQVRLLVGLEPEDDFTSFGVELRTLSGQEVWRQDGLHPRPSPAGRAIELTLPGGVLETGSYELALEGVIDPRDTEELRYYYFVVLGK